MKKNAVASGPIPPNPSELLQTSRFVEFIEEVSAKYERIIFDSPPLGVVTDAAVLASQISGAILVIQSDKTTRDAAGSCAKQLVAVGANVLGAVINSVDLTSNGRYGYGSYYYYYRGYNYYYDSDHSSKERRAKKEESRTTLV